MAIWLTGAPGVSAIARHERFGRIGPFHDHLAQNRPWTRLRAPRPDRRAAPRRPPWSPRRPARPESPTAGSAVRAFPPRRRRSAPGNASRIRSRSCRCVSAQEHANAFDRDAADRPGFSFANHDPNDRGAVRFRVAVDHGVEHFRVGGEQPFFVRRRSTACSKAAGSTTRSASPPTPRPRTASPPESPDYP